MKIKYSIDRPLYPKKYNYSSALDFVMNEDDIYFSIGIRFKPNKISVYIDKWNGYSKVFNIKHRRSIINIVNISPKKINKYIFITTLSKRRKIVK